MLEILLLLLPLFGSASCQGTLTGLGSYGCDVDSGVSTLQACDAVNSTIRSCFADPKATAFIESCFCKQDALNNIIDCESEFRLCYLNDRFDYLAQSVLENWHTWCDNYVTFIPTTPALSQPGSTAPTLVGGSQEPLCTDFLTSCAIWTAAAVKCLELDPSATATSFTECACSTSLLSLASVCLYDLNTTCLGHSAALSNIPLFSVCGVTYSNDVLFGPSGTTTLFQQEGPSTTSLASTGAVASTTAASQTRLSSTSTQASATQPSATATSANSSAAKVLQTRSPLGFRFVLYVIWHSVVSLLM